MKLTLSLAAIVILLASSGTRAADTVKKISGGTINGSIQSLGKSEVVIEKQAGGTETVPITDVETITFDNEPTRLRSVRSSAASGAYTNAINTINQIDASSITRNEIIEDLQFYKAYCEAKKALDTGGSVTEPGQLMRAFVTEHPTSYHAYVANELLGDLLVAANRPELAVPYYAELGSSPFPEYKMRSGVAQGKALLAQRKFSEAQTAFDGVLQLAAQQKGPAVDHQRLLATLGKAACVAEGGSPDDGIKMIEEVINATTPEDAAIQAQAYVTMGDCYLKKPDAKKQALLAFLHVDVLYPSQQHAEAAALKQLAVLWKDLNKPDRAQDALQRLSQLPGGKTATP
jgi:tetratricopeptide (TPR) repeat protein